MNQSSMMDLPATILGLIARKLKARLRARKQAAHTGKARQSMVALQMYCWLQRCALRRGMRSVCAVVAPAAAG